MGRAGYEIVKADGGWSVSHQGETSGPYATKEAAFEAAVGAASNAIKLGHEVNVHVPGSAPTEPVMGSR